MAWVSPRTYVAGAVLTAAQLNETRDALNWIARVGINGWPSFTPTWTSTGTAPAIGNGTLLGSYAQVGRSTWCFVRFRPGSTTTFGTGSYRWALPVAENTDERSTGAVYIEDGSTYYVGTAKTVTGDTSNIEVITDSGIVGQTSPMTWANGDDMVLGFGPYQAAS